MNEQERRIVELGYNLSQAYLKAKRNKQYKTCLSIICSIYVFNGLAIKIIPEFKKEGLGKDLFKIGQLWHNQLISGQVPAISGIGKGLSFENDDFEIDEVIKKGVQ